MFTGLRLLAECLPTTSSCKLFDGMSSTSSLMSQLDGLSGHVSKPCADFQVGMEMLVISILASRDARALCFVVPSK